MLGKGRCRSVVSGMAVGINGPRAVESQEILVNAADNLIRDPSMDTIKVDIDRDANRITDS